MNRTVWNSPLTLAAGLILVQLGQAFIHATPKRQLDSVQTRGAADGAYTAAQAERGRTLFEVNCGGCHGTDLGGDSARSLAGPAFRADWSDEPLSTLFERMQSMPPDSPGSLEERDYLEILSYILHVNALPEGHTPLTRDRLGTIEIVGPADIPDYALVQIVGCLRSHSSNRWLLTESTTPVRTRDPDFSDEAVQNELQDVILGAETVELINPYPNPTPQRDWMVAVKGFIFREGDRVRINTTSLMPLSQSCRN